MEGGYAMKKYMVLILILCVLIMSACAKGLEKGCKELGNAYDVMVKAEKIAQAGHEKDPNLVTEDHLIELEMIINTLQRLQVITCNLDTVISQRDKLGK